MISRLLVLAIVGVCAAKPAMANFCAGPSLFIRYEQAHHVFVGEFTRAEYRPDSIDSRWPGTVFAWFDVVETLKGNPDEVTHLEYRITRPYEQWGAQVQIGKPLILFSGNDGKVTVDECSEHSLETRSCNLYAFRKMAGTRVEPDAGCDLATLRYRFRLKQITPEADKDDYQALRLEWYERFGEWPD